MMMTSLLQISTRAIDIKVRPCPQIVSKIAKSGIMVWSQTHF